MGLFDFLSPKPKQVAAPQAPAAPDPGLSPWQQTLWRAEHSPGFVWEDGNGPARSLVCSLLQCAAPAFGNGTVVNGEPTTFVSHAGVLINRFGGDEVRLEDTNPELHGVWDGMPVRIPISIPAKKFWAIEMRCQERTRFLTILRDLGRIPRPRDPNDPWLKHQPTCVFLGKGIYVDDFDPNLARDWLLPTWASLPAAAQEVVVREMERLDLRCFALSNTDMSLVVVGNVTLHQLGDPLVYLAACATFLADFAKALAASEGTGASSAAQQCVTCQYCTSIFIVAAGKNRCPNCGAPAA
jgi:hypothetical protein